MTTLNINCITTREQYDEVRVRVNELITEATKKGLLEPNADNDYIREIGRLVKLSAEYEDNYLNILPLKMKNPRYFKPYALLWQNFPFRKPILFLIKNLQLPTEYLLMVMRSS